MFFQHAVCSQLARQELPWQPGKDTIEEKAAQGELHKDCSSDSVLKYLLSVVHKKAGLQKMAFQVVKSFTDLGDWETKPSEKNQM